MTISQMLGQSGLLTLLGMAVVFSFLIIMIICMYALHGVLHVLGMDKDKKVEAPVSSAAPSASKQDDGAVVAAIAAAIKTKN